MWLEGAPPDEHVDRAFKRVRGRDLAVLIDRMPDGERVEAKYPQGSTRRPGLGWNARDIRERERDRIGPVERAPQGPVEAGKLREHGLIGARADKPWGEAVGIPAQVRLPGSGGIDESTRQFIESRIAEPARRVPISFAHGRDQPRSIGLAVDPKPGGDGKAAAPGHRMSNVARLAQKVRPEGELCLEELLWVPHAASNPAPMRRAITSSATRSPSGGMWSSRSIIVATPPKRERASA